MVHRSVMVAILVMAMLTTPATDAFGPSRRSGAVAVLARSGVTVTARLTGWIARRDGYHLYREGATVRLVVVVKPNLHGERVRGRLEWRRPGRPWRVLDVSATRLNLDSRGLFLVRGLPPGYSFRMRARVRASNGHPSGRSRWSYFRVG